MIMYDTIVNREIPGDAVACAAYVDGSEGDQPNFVAVSLMFPGAAVLSIALDAGHDADCLDMENGAAGVRQFPAWYRRQAARGVSRPCGYASVSLMATGLMPVLAGAGIPRAAVRLWSAHTGRGEHVCGLRSCGAIGVDVDGTQWTFSALRRNLDQSLLRDDFFGAPVTVPVPGWQERAVQALGYVQEGSTGQRVRTVQALLGARGEPGITVDGVFGPRTYLGVAALQSKAGLAADGIVGPRTWPVLLGVS